MIVNTDHSDRDDACDREGPVAKGDIEFPWEFLSDNGASSDGCHWSCLAPEKYGLLVDSRRGTISA